MGCGWDDYVQTGNIKNLFITFVFAFCSQTFNGFNKFAVLETIFKQGCILFPFLFILGIDWVLKQVTSGGRSGIRETD